jgi:hypothetical protein
MTDPEHLRRLHFIDALFAGLTGHDLYLAQQIQAAIAASLAAAQPAVSEPPAIGDGSMESGDADPAEPAFAAAAVRLAQRLGSGQPECGFFHWDAAESAVAATPLFVREKVLAGLKTLSRFRESTLLVTNLRRAHCPPRRRWTDRREREYRESLALIRDLAAARTRRGANLNILFL